MTRSHRFVLACLAVLLLVASPAAAQRKRAPTPPPAPAPVLPPPDIRVRSELSQTAAWVGDPLQFIVEIDTAPGVEVVTEDLAPERLVVEGLELGGATSTMEPRADGWRTVRHAYTVTPWDTTPPKRIGDLTVRFRRPVTAATASGAAEASDIKVAGATLAVRSTLPDDGSADGARDRLAALPSPAWLGWLRPAGLGFIALGIAPVVLWVATRVRRPRVTTPRASSRSLHAQIKSMFDELRIIDTSTTEGRRRAYDRIDADVRAYLAQAEALPALALTADELRPRLAESKRVRAGEVCDILAECEHARYGPDDRLPAAEAVRSTIERLQSALGR
ncbi:MAG: hypothetical protein IT177_10740 [Acidobacteria bacterium]|nr:hypothetical protein [Acidobacteriota bacterium]